MVRMTNVSALPRLYYASEERIKMVEFLRLSH